jgi:hypothetical protein
MFYPITTEQITRPCSAGLLKDVVFPFNLIRLSSGDPTGAERLVNQNRVFYDRVRGMGAPFQGCEASAVCIRVAVAPGSLGRDHWPRFSGSLSLSPL